MRFLGSTQYNIQINKIYTQDYNNDSRCNSQGAIVVAIVCTLVFQLSVQTAPITTNVVSSNRVRGKM